jgi:hypothetical protein
MNSSTANRTFVFNHIFLIDMLFKRCGASQVRRAGGTKDFPLLSAIGKIFFDHYFLPCAVITTHAGKPDSKDYSTRKDLFIKHFGTGGGR